VSPGCFPSSRQRGGADRRVPPPGDARRAAPSRRRSRRRRRVIAEKQCTCEKELKSTRCILANLCMQSQETAEQVFHTNRQHRAAGARVDIVLSAF